MKFRSVHVNRDGYCSLGIDEETGGYVLEVVMTWVAWYSRYFRLTKEEFDEYSKSQDLVAKLAKACAASKGIESNRERFINSQMTEENL